MSFATKSRSSQQPFRAPVARIAPALFLASIVGLGVILSFVGVTAAEDSIAQLETNPVSEADRTATVERNTEFAFSLYLALSEQNDSNFFVSPHSVSVALAMTWEGAQGETADEMARTLGLQLPRDRQHAAFQSLAAELASRGETQSDDGDPFQLSIVNALWSQAGHPFRPEFIQAVETYYGAGVRLVDFIAAAEAARTQINDWVAEQTDNKILNLIPEGVLNSLTRLVLTNAIYFKASWASPFPEAATRDDTFTRLDDRQVAVRMMGQTGRFRLYQGPDYTALELPYVGNEVSMLVLAPLATGEYGRWQDFENWLTSDAELDTIMGSLGTSRIHLRMPRFRFEFALSLVDTLAAMGMPSAFDPVRADLDRMDGGAGDLYITEILHKAFVDVNEAGTEAAAATAVVVGSRSMRQTDPPVVLIDRPFVFLIRDNATGTVLFVGRVLDPTL